MAKATLHKKKALFKTRLVLNVRKNPVKCYIWSAVLCGAEIWALRDVDQKYLESSGMWCWRRTAKISWTDRVRNGRRFAKSLGGEENPTNEEEGGIIVLVTS